MIKNDAFLVKSSGSSFGVLSLLTRWFSAVMILFISETLIGYGILGILGIILSIVGAFFTFGYVTSKARVRYKDSISLYDIVQSKATGFTKKVMSFYFLMISLGMVLLQVIAIDLVLHELFHIPLFITKSIFFLVLLMYILLIGDTEKIVIEPIFIIILFSTVIFIPAYFFIQQGIQPVYEGIWLYHPYLLFWKDYDSLSFIPTFFIAFFSILLVDRVSWKQLFSMKTTKIGITMVLTGLTLGTLLLASIAIMFVSLSFESFNNASTIMFKMINHLNPLFLFILFALFCFVVCIKAIATELSAFIQVSKNKENQDIQSKTKNIDKKQLKFIIVIIIFVTIITSIYTPIGILGAIFYYSLFCTSMLFPVLVIIFRNTKVSCVLPWAVSIGFVGGLLSSILGVDKLASIWISILLSTFISLFVMFKRKIG